MAERCIAERTPEGVVWHWARGAGDSSFQPIRCARDEGIVLPGNRETRDPTCPNCLEILALVRGDQNEPGSSS